MSRDGSVGVAPLMGVAVSVSTAVRTPIGVPAVDTPSFDDVYAAHAGFVWRVLRALGVAESVVEDAVQDVFVVVHRRLGEWEGRAALTTWLFAIARRVASGYRRKTARPGAPLEAELARVAGPGDPFAAVSRWQAARVVAEILDSLDDDQRLVFALVELEQLAVPEVARMLDIKLNTAYSRLRLARVAFEAAVRRRGTR